MHIYGLHIFYIDFAMIVVFGICMSNFFKVVLLSAKCAIVLWLRKSQYKLVTKAK